jgi:secondary thiamine-phosphate synthase enzyme
MLIKQTLKTGRESYTDITASVKNAILQSTVTSGIAIVYCPHTTAGITINENADADVVYDLLFALREVFYDNKAFRHMEGNSAAHLKALVTGSSVSLIIEERKPILGTWQGIFFAEYDGPRTRTYYIKIIGD